MAQEKWVELARKLLKKELKKKQMTYEMLREALNSIGVVARFHNHTDSH